MSRWLKIATFCGAVPLLLGVLIYIVWRITRWDGLMFAGMINIVAGLLAVFIGGVILLLNKSLPPSADSHAKQQQRRRIASIAALLLVNFPVAAFCVVSAGEIKTRYTVEVRNETDVTIESFSLTAPGVDLEFGPIVLGRTIKRHMHFEGDGVLSFKATQGETHFNGEVESYVTNSMGGYSTIRVTNPGEFSIKNVD